MGYSVCMSVEMRRTGGNARLRKEVLLEARARIMRARDIRGSGMIPCRDNRVYWRDPSGEISGNVMGAGILVCGEDGVWLVEERDMWRNRVAESKGMAGRPLALSDIGGKCEKVKGVRNVIENPWDTIGREFVEETYGSLGEICNMEELWLNGKKVVCRLPSPANIRDRVVRDVKYVCLVVNIEDVKGVEWNVDKFREGYRKACDWIEKEKNGDGGWVGTNSKEWEDEVSTVGLRYVKYSELRGGCVLSGRLRNILKLMGMIV